MQTASTTRTLDRHITEQAEQAAVVFAAHEVAEYTEADEAADGREETPCRRCERRLLADPKCEYCEWHR